MKKINIISLAIGLMLFSLSACSDDDNERIINTEIEMQDGQNFMNLSRYAGEYKIDISTEADAAWQASVDGIFAYIAWADTIGVGSKTITLYTTTNRYDEDRTANLHITFPGHKSSDKIIPLKQLGKSHDSENIDELKVGNQIYAVGFGYDTRDKWANPTSLKAEVLRTNELITNGDISLNSSINSKVEVDIFTGSSVSEMTNELNTSANIKGGGWGFKGEAGASFNMKDFSSNKYEYAIVNMNIAKNSVSTSGVAAGAKAYMTPEAYNDINGIIDTTRSHTNCAYPSDEKGFDKLINAYGTHVVNSAKLGGQLKYAMRMDISKIKGSYDLKAFANMSYKGFGVEANASVSDELKKSYEQNQSHIHTTVSVLGGSDAAALEILDKNGIIDNETFSKWITSLTDNDNLALVDFESDALIPLYEFVDRINYPERYEKLKSYMEKGRIESINSINMEYQCGTSVKINGLPEFPTSGTGTLIKDVYNHGQWVGRICNEYIPVINKKERITIVYPVFSNTVKYNMGYFIGDAGHKPARVCWQGDNLIVTECHEDSIGEKTTLYLRGSDVSSICYDNYVDGTIEDATIVGYISILVHNYPIVKIFNRIWIREDYRPAYNNNGDDIDYRGRTFYHFEVVNNIAPSNWRVTSKSDFLSIKKTMADNGESEAGIANAFGKEKVLGFDNSLSGWYEDYSPIGVNTYGAFGCITNKGEFDGIVIIGENTFQVSETNNWKDKNYYGIRIVQDIEQ